MLTIVANNTFNAIFAISLAKYYGICSDAHIWPSYYTNEISLLHSKRVAFIDRSLSSKHEEVLISNGSELFSFEGRPDMSACLDFWRTIESSFARDPIVCIALNAVNAYTLNKDTLAAVFGAKMDRLLLAHVDYETSQPVRVIEHSNYVNSPFREPLLAFETIIETGELQQVHLSQIQLHEIEMSTLVRNAERNARVKRDSKGMTYIVFSAPSTIASSVARELIRIHKADYAIARSPRQRRVQAFSNRNGFNLLELDGFSGSQNVASMCCSVQQAFLSNTAFVVKYK